MPLPPDRCHNRSSRSPTVRSRCSLKVAQGLSNSEIAAELFITLSTVKTHLTSLMTKLGARNRVEIAIWAHQTKRVPARP